MPASPARNHLWPERTAASAPLVARHASSSKIAPRQIVTDQAAVAAAKNRCEFDSGNEVVSCFPTADVVVPQHQWAEFVWNSNNPDFTQTERVDIYLFHGDSLQLVHFWPNQINLKGQAGSITAQANDSWWGDRGANWAGQNISYPFYFLISRSGEPLSDGTQKPQTTFSAVQTTFADSVLSSMASTRTATSLASSSTVLTTVNALTTVTGKIQSNSSGAPFPTWAIVMIVLGIILLIAICACMLFMFYCMRQRDVREAGREAGHRPIRSTPPSMTQPDAPGAPLAAAALAHAASTTSHGQRTTSPAQRTVSPDSTERPFSQSDAAVMASAFRTALRQPGRPLADDERSQSPALTERDTLLERELGDVGTDIRRVDSVRGVRVESSSEGHDLSPRRSF